MTETDSRGPRRVLPSRRSWPLHDAAATRAIEQVSAAGLPAHALMARAGWASARLALAVAPHARAVEVLCGPGNNGGDGMIAALHLRRAGKPVTARLLADAHRLPVDARDALEQARTAGVRIEPGLPDRIDAELVIDALLGIGANRIVDGPLAQAVQRIDASAATVLSIDLPSGLHADTGAVLGQHAVRATHTLALLTLKPGLFTGLGRDHAGDIWLDDLGVQAPAQDDQPSLTGPELLRGLTPTRRHAQHKGSFGDTFIIGGAPGMGGAALLAGRAALAAGAGRVYLGLLAADDAHPVDPLRPELMVRPLRQLLSSATLASATVVCGCGGGAAVRDHLPEILHHARRLVLDADALNAIAADAGLRRALRARAARGLASIVTPHPLEAARLLNNDAPWVQADRLRAARQLAEQLDCCVLLKGSGSVTAAPALAARINPTGNARLASAGTGDVLAGWLGGLWTQQPDGTHIADVAASAAWVHGAAAEGDHGHGALRALDLIDRMVARAADAQSAAPQDRPG
jgi:ADP-dependent NAD(P)H-hydrate dehydratase / NAD(P)H-hydrate epimerase